MLFMNNVYEHFVRWLNDPFNRKEIAKHDEIIDAIQRTKERSAERSKKYARATIRFPISAQVEKPKPLKGRNHYVRA